MNSSTFWGILLLWSTIHGSTFYMMRPDNPMIAAFYGVMGILYMVFMFIAGGLEWRESKREQTANNVIITVNNQEEDKS